MTDHSEDEDYQRFLASVKDPFAHKSQRHHYIPRFYLEGFTDSQGMLFVYDKQKDIIRRQSPKSSFFEWDRNSISNNEGKKMSLLEDTLFAQLDNQSAPILANLRNNPNDDKLLSLENTSLLSFFIINLFWRIPKTDDAYDRFYKESVIKLYDKEGNVVDNPELIDKVRNDKEMQKAHRAGIFVETVKRMQQKGRVMNKLIEFHNDDVLITGDFPFCYHHLPSTLEGVVYNEMFIPISSRRVFFHAEGCGLEMELDKIMIINAMIIEESVRYVCGPNREFLQKCVDYYKSVKENHILLFLRNRLFTGSYQL